MTTPPGARLLAFASRWFDAATVSRVFEPLVADWQREWSETPPVRCAGVVVRGSAALAHAAVCSAPRVLMTPAPPGVMRRVAMRVLLFVGVPCALLSIPVLRSLPGEMGVVLLLLTLPTSAAAALPFAMVAAADAIRCHEAMPDHVQRAVAVKVGLAAIVIVFLSVGWVSPASGRAWRGITSGDTRSAGLRELSIIDLVTHPARQQEARPFTISGTVRRELNNRGSLVVLPLLVLWLRWRLLELPQGRWVSPLPATVVALLTLAAFLITRLFHFEVEATLGLRPGSGMWTLLVIFALWGMASHWLARRTHA